jgi:hypothetical protein
MAVAIAGHSSSAFTNNTSGYTLSSYTPAAGSNRVLVVRVHGLRTADDTATFSVDSVTFGGVALTEASTVRNTSSSRVYRAAVWYLVNPSSSAGDVVVTFSQAAGGCIIAADTLTGVNLTAPYRHENSATDADGGEIVVSMIAPWAGHLILAAVTSHCQSNPSWTWSGSPIGTAPVTEQYDMCAGDNVSTEVSGSGASMEISSDAGSYYARTYQISTRPQAMCAVEFSAALGSLPPIRRQRTYVRM